MYRAGGSVAVFGRVDVQGKCPANCSAEMSFAYSWMVSDADPVGRRVGGLSASMYLLIVCL